MRRPDGPDSRIERTSQELFEGLKNIFQATNRRTLTVGALVLTLDDLDGLIVNLGTQNWQYTVTRKGIYRFVQNDTNMQRPSPCQNGELEELLSILYSRASSVVEARRSDHAQSPTYGGDFLDMDNGELQIWVKSIEALLGPEPRPVNPQFFKGIDQRQLSPTNRLPVQPPAAKAPNAPYLLAPQEEDGDETAYLRRQARVADLGQKIAGEAIRRGEEAEQLAREEAKQRRAAERAAKEAHGKAGTWRKLFHAGLAATALGVLGTAGVLTVGTGVVLTHPEEVKSALGISENKLVKPLSAMKLPEGISDTGALLLAAAPVEQGKLYEDSLLDSYGLKSALFDGKFLVMGAEEIDYGGKTRAYQFSVPSADNGEQEQGETKASFADAINLLLRSDLTDDNLKDWIVYWFSDAYTDQAGAPIKLERDKILIERDDQKKVSSVLYTGPNKDAKVRYEKVRYNEATTKTSATARRTTYQQPKNFVASDGELLLFTGGTLNQQLLVPETLLKKDGVGDLKAHGEDFTFTWQELAAGVRQYFEVKDRKEIVTFTDPDGNLGSVDTWSRYATPNDTILVRIVTKITEGKTGEPRFEAVRMALQDTPYVPESRATEANRPPIATLLKEGGDCNNQAVKAASYLEAAGYDAALLYAMRSDTEAKAAEAKGDAFAYSTHVLVGVDEADLGFDAAADAVKYTNAAGTVWVVLETNGDHKLGSMPLKDFHVVLADEVK